MLELEENIYVKEETIQRLDALITSEKFNFISEVKGHKLTCRGFGKTLGDRGEEIVVNLCFQKDQFGGKNVSISILNSHEGQMPAIKAEIDRVSEKMYSEIVQVFGEQNITVTREAIRPPM